MKLRSQIESGGLPPTEAAVGVGVGVESIAFGLDGEQEDANVDEEMDEDGDEDRDDDEEGGEFGEF